MRQYMTELSCKACHGHRLNEQALAVKVNHKHISEVLELSVDEEI